VRESLNLTTENVAELVGVHESSVGQWERDECRPIRMHMAKLLDAFPMLTSIASRVTSKEGSKPGRAMGYDRPTHREVAVFGEPAIEAGQVPPVLKVVTPAPVPVPVQPVAIDPAVREHALVEFGMALGSCAGALKAKGARDAVLNLLRAGDTAGLSVAAIIVAIERRG
jgi:DNA-binding XRE family transcriptional regulator